MKKRFGLVAILCIFFWSCSEERITPEDTSSGELQVTYRVMGADITRNVASEEHEKKIGEIYTLFFRSGSHATAPGRYAGYSRVEVTDGNTSGSARITLPAGESINDAWQLVFLANLSSCMQNSADPGSWLTGLLTDKTLAEANSLLVGYAGESTGIHAPFIMAAGVDKAANVKEVSASFSRKVSRVDVASSAADFVLESAQLWNARTKAYLSPFMAEIYSATGIGDFTHYTNGEKTATTNVIEAALYCYPNISVDPEQTDQQTTCVIIAGRWKGNPTSYYRVNICQTSQYLQPNGAYTIGITHVTADGADTPEDAYQGTGNSLEYIVNEWDESYQGGYVYDASGNGLAVSERSLLFWDEAGEEAQIEVYCLVSPTNPPATSWQVEGITGEGADAFEAVKNSDNTLLIKTIANNSTDAYREAWVHLRWGTITLPVQLTQRSLEPKIVISSSGGLFFKESETEAEVPEEQELVVRVTAPGPVTASDIVLEAVYKEPDRHVGVRMLHRGEGQPMPEDNAWLTITPLPEKHQPDQGLFYYTVRVDNNFHIYGKRMAEIKVTATSGKNSSRTWVHVQQEPSIIVDVREPAVLKFEIIDGVKYLIIDLGTIPISDLSIVVEAMRAWIKGYPEVIIIASSGWGGSIYYMPQGDEDGYDIFSYLVDFSYNPLSPPLPGDKSTMEFTIGISKSGAMNDIAYWPFIVRIYATAE